MLVHEVHKFNWFHIFNYVQKQDMKRIHIALVMMIQDMAGQSSSSGVSRYGARVVSVQENLPQVGSKHFLKIFASSLLQIR